MKIIDLLNKIANGEEVPKKIKLNEIIFEYQGEDYLFIDKDNTDNWLFSEPYSDKFEYLENFLKSEVEIIEEKKLPKRLFNCCMHTDNEEIKFLIQNINDFADKWNELIDYLESKETGE